MRPTIPSRRWWTALVSTFLLLGIPLSASSWSLPATGTPQAEGPRADDSVPAAGLPASPCAATEARQFDFWHGFWKVNNRFHTDNGWVDAGSADVRVYPAVGGCLTIEHWQGNLGDSEIRGFSARAWDEQARQWVLLLNWPSPRAATFGTLEGSFRHGRGEFFRSNTDAEGNERLTRFAFADISPDRFRWDQSFSQDDGRTWHTRWIMEYSRRDPFRDRPTFVGPTRDVARCDAPEYRQFDFLLGDWRASAEIPRRDGTVHEQRARMRAVPILHGCAVMDFYETVGENPEFEAFRIRAYDESAGHWVQYWFDTVDRVFQRFEGGRQEDGRIVLAGRLDPDDESRGDRITWSENDDGTLSWSYEISSDGGATWRDHARATFRR